MRRTPSIRLLPASAGVLIGAVRHSSSNGPNERSPLSSTKGSAAQNLDGYVTPDQSRLSFETTSDPKKSPVARQTAKIAEGGRVARTINDDGTVTGMRSFREGWPIYASVLFVLISYVVVTKTEEAQLARRHTSIEKDIERERWRAKELGLASDDDGFADKYMTKLGEEKNKGGVFVAPIAVTGSDKK